MMTIEGKNRRTGSWHVGEPMRIPDGQVITFQVDGDELEFLLGVLRRVASMDREITHEMHKYSEGVNWKELLPKVIYPAPWLTPVL